MEATALLTTLSEGLAAITDQAARRIVSISGGTRPGCSGFIWQNNVIVTADRALRGDDPPQVTFPDAGTVAGTLVGRDRSTGTAVLRIEAGVAAPPTAALDPPTGALVLAIGRRGATAIARMGIISEVGEAWRSLRGGRIDRFVRLDIRLDSAGEGGAVLDGEGKLIGMPVFGPRGRVLVIPAATLARVVPQILAEGTISRGYLGLGLHPVAHGPGAQGHLLVVSVDPDGPAVAAGVLLGDVVTSWNGDPLAGLRDLMARLGPESAGAATELGLVRAGAATKLRLHVGKRPD
jgi:S1-C subfamily serine protease